MDKHLPQLEHAPDIKETIIQLVEAVTPLALYPAKNLSNGPGWMPSEYSLERKDKWNSSMLRQDSPADPCCAVFYSHFSVKIEFAFRLCHDERLERYVHIVPDIGPR